MELKTYQGFQDGVKELKTEQGSQEGVGDRSRFSSWSWQIRFLKMELKTYQESQDGVDNTGFSRWSWRQMRVLKMEVTTQGSQDGVEDRWGFSRWSWQHRVLKMGLETVCEQYIDCLMFKVQKVELRTDVPSQGSLLNEKEVQIDECRYSWETKIARSEK